MDAMKKEALQSIEKMPETATIEEIMYRLYVLDKIAKGREAVRVSKVVSVDELKKEMRQW
ncbi:MAG: hypothetical protein HYV29_10490 [Ignavibacteriales bacterium]|nr:hypothetical protein [Ignavibacteriales bacterium]